MKTAFIEVNHLIKLPKINFSGKFGLVYTSQYEHLVKQVLKNKNFILGGQVVGCNVNNAIKIKNNVDKFYFLGDGRFHAEEIALRTEKEVVNINKEKITIEEIENLKKRIKGKQLRFLNAKKVGIIKSIKPSQDFGDETKLKKSLEKKGKKVYLFLSDNIENLENFPDIDIFVNLSCPRIEEKSIISIIDLPVRYGKG